jgi:hypothetical protein
MADAKQYDDKPVMIEARNLKRMDKMFSKLPPGLNNYVARVNYLLSMGMDHIERQSEVNRRVMAGWGPDRNGNMVQNDLPVKEQPCSVDS